MTDTLRIHRMRVILKNCYGIRSLEHTFDFTEKMPVVIYSPNGAMKTSFALTFQDITSGETTTDRIYPNRETVRNIVDQDDSPISGENIFVIQSYDKEYHSERISTLLVNKKLKDEYDGIYHGIGESKDTLLNGLKKQSGISKTSDIEIELSKIYNKKPKDLLTVLGRLDRELKKFNEPNYANIKYKSIFSPKIIAFLENKEFKEKIEEYTIIYEKLMENSNYFKKGIFNHNNASTIAKNLKTNGWFDGGHSVNLKSIMKTIEVNSQDKLEKLIQEEKDSIIENEELKSSFNKIDKALSNKELKDFRDFLVENPFVIQDLKNITGLGEKIWLSYLKENQSDYDKLIEVYDSGEERIKAIIDSAGKEVTKWKRVIDIFNDRFSVPFIVNMDNQDDVILGRDSPQISFDFQDEQDGDKVRIDEENLKNYLSTGERKSLYLLNIIFEVEARIEADIETLFIVDDIADSFDYKNKYAIIEYLHDIKKNNKFKLIILTHNFDFYRIIKRRFNIYNDNKLHSIKTSDDVKLVPDYNKENPFMSWRSNLSNIGKFIASVPFFRNLAEYTGDADRFNKLTSLLHVKKETYTLTISDIAEIYKGILHKDVPIEITDDDKIFTEQLFSLCQTIANNNTEIISLENKIVLAIGIRLKAEEYMIRKINNSKFVLGIKENQTSKLINEFKKKCKNEVKGIDYVDKVQLMTPENIHLNSFMFEPIMDMSDLHLKQLYKTSMGLVS